MRQTILNTPSKSNLLSIATYGLCLVLFTACSKNNNESEITPSGKQNLFIMVSGIEAPVIKQLEASSQSNNREIATAANEVEEITNIDGIQASTSFQTNSYGDEQGSSNSKKQLQKLAATAPVNQSIRYRFILFQKNQNNSYTYIGHKDATRLTSYELTAFEVLKGSTYKWVAYSYNTADNITDVINANNFTIVTPINKDLLYATDEFLVPNNTPGVSEDIKVNIVFKHRLARLAITLKANDFPAIIRNSGSQNFSAQLSTASQNFFKKGNLNLLDNSLSNVTNQAFTGLLPFNAASNSVGDSTRVAYLYTADLQNTMPNISIRVNYMMFQDIYSYRDGNYPSISNRDITINTRNIVAQAGVSYDPTINFLNNDGIRKGNLIWARGNLTYNPTTKKYSIQKTPSGVNVSMERDYWMYNSLTPWDPGIVSHATHRAAIWETAKDPCRQVPGGWRLPTADEFLALGGRETPVSDRLQSPNWDNQAPVTAPAATRPRVFINQDSYTSFRGDDGQWATFFKTAAFDTGYSDYSRWSLVLNDSGMFMVSDGNGTGSSFRSIQIDGEQTYFKSQSRILDFVKAIRCVRNI